MFYFYSNKEKVIIIPPPFLPHHTHYFLFLCFNKSCVTTKTLQSSYSTVKNEWIIYCLIIDFILIDTQIKNLAKFNHIPLPQRK